VIHALKQKGRFPNTRVSPDQSQRAGDETASQNTIQFSDAARGTSLRRRCEGLEPLDLIGGCNGSASCGGCAKSFFQKRVPLLAVRAFSHPFWALMSTGLAGKYGFLLLFIGHFILSRTENIIFEKIAGFFNFFCDNFRFLFDSRQ
jgi:hypothetical protein